MSGSEPAAPRPSLARDLFALTKPSITRMCLITTAGGLWLAPQRPSPLVVAATLLGTAMTVGSANALNMWWERETDQLMARTRVRPLAAGRMEPQLALRFGIALGLAGVVLLATVVNGLTAALAAAAILSYVLIYTPMKYRSPLALLIGAIPGAAPPLIGWTAVQGEIAQPGLVLFGILLLWQLPHFLAIALFRKKEYARAGIQVVPVVRGDFVAKVQAIAWATALLPISLLLTPLGVTGTLYTVVAFVIGAVFLVWSLTGLRRDAGARWARGFFFASLVYLPVLTMGLVLDQVLF